MTTLTAGQFKSLYAASNQRWSHVALLCIALGGLGMSLVTYKYFGTFIRGADAQMYYAQVRSLIVDGDLAYENEITQLSPQRAVFYNKAGELNVPRTADGRIINKYTFGWAMITCPPFALVHLTQRITGGDAGGYSNAYELAVALWHLLIVIAACAVLMRAAARLYDDRCAAIVVVGTFFATNVIYYTSAYPLMAHAASFAMIAIVVSLAVHLYESPDSMRLWFYASIFSALVVLLRPTDGVMLVVLLPAAARTERSRERRWGVRLMMVPLGVVASVVLQLVIWRISYGSWVVNSYGSNGEGFNWFAPALPDILISMNHGAWYFHPFLLVGFIGLIAAVSSQQRDRRSLWLAMLVAVVLHIYVHACWHDWSFSHSFGHRLFANSAPLMALGAAALLHRLTVSQRRAAVAVLALLIAWNLLLTITFIRGGFAPVGPVTPGQIIAAQLKTVGL